MYLLDGLLAGGRNGAKYGGVSAGSPLRVTMGVVVYELRIGEAEREVERPDTGSPL